MDKEPSYEELQQKVKELEKEALERKRSDESLVREKTFSESIIDSLPGIFYFFDNKGKFLRWNKNLEEISEYSTEEISTMNPLDFFVEKDKANVSDKIRETFVRGRSFVEAVVVSKSGNEICFYLTGRLVLINNESYLVGMGIDITERKRAGEAIRESEQFLSAIFNSIQDGISVLDKDLKIISVNQAMQGWYAHMLPLEGKRCFEAYHMRTEVCEVCPSLRALESGKLEMDEIPLTQAEGVTGTLELFAFPMLGDSGNTTGVVEYVRDITERKRAEEANKELTEKIKLFAYSVSHDLKNPAIAINLLARALHRDHEDILDEKGKTLCRHIMKASEQLAALVGQINLYISTKEVPLNIESVNLNQVFDTVRDEFSDQIMVRQISWLQPEKFLEINVDRLSILRVLRNVVDNALKYGGDDLSRIEIGYEESNEYHILSIEDDGIGIAKGDSKNIFDLFSRAVTSREIDGTGLGLAIANEIAEQHEGKVWAEPGKEKGAIFFISIAKGIRPTN